MIFKTLSGSTYEVNKLTKQIRRINGMDDPQPRQGKDGEFKTYSSINVENGKSALIIWPQNVPLLNGTQEKLTEFQIGIPATATSEVIDIVGT